MKKRTLAILSAVMILAMSSMTVFAEEPEVGTVNPPDEGQVAVTAIEGVMSPEAYLAATSVSSGFSISAVSQQTIDSVKVAVQNSILNHLAFIGGTGLYDNAIAAAATDPTAKVTATILTVVYVENTGAAPISGGYYPMHLKVQGASEGDSIVLLRYRNSKWGINNFVSASLPSEVRGYIRGNIFDTDPSIYAIVRLNVTTGIEAPVADTAAVDTAAVETPAADTPESTPIADTPAVETPVTETPLVETPAADAAATTPAAEAPAADAAQTPSPQTGETVPMAAVILAVGLTGAVICGKKVFV